MSDGVDNSSSWDQIQEAFQASFPTHKYSDVGVVIGCSGGADSVALLRTVVERLSQHAQRQLRSGTQTRSTACRGFVVVAHFNHALRGSQSEGDHEFVVNLAGQLGVQVVTRRGSGNRSDEDYARRQRYGFFREVLQQHGARYLMLGHNLEDNVETVLFRLMRGTGPAGLAGIAPFREFSSDEDGRDFVIARPMLSLSRELIRQGMRSEGYAWRDDASNESDQYSRNWIRNELLPKMAEQFPDVTQGITRAIASQRQWAETIGRLADDWLDKNLVSDEPLVLRRSDELEKQDAAVTVEALRVCFQKNQLPLRSMSQLHWQRLLELICGSGSGSIHLPGAIVAVRESATIRIYRDQQA
ncbi:tRNA lysidine(34) synthetase TilS [Stieleria sp. JC731]|uniref:tRNA lysidine(34) synthetase TilS n=1 Tax=Pirellulaceae TaxID=2691357 RepID=UPI001E5F68A2|nr:tRNA lysidine(34) synthetase TilS [Stieleria sp. JC731]MCC9599903.1 tRNA lysidine(34) synthetase TilS [Stieleria sp. JC731]